MTAVRGHPSKLVMRFDSLSAAPELECPMRSISSQRLAPVAAAITFPV